jgi:hypothetical protein
MLEHEPEKSKEEAIYEIQCSIADEIEKQIRNDPDQAMNAFINFMSEELNVNDYELLKSIIENAIDDPFSKKFNPFRFHFIRLLNSAIVNEAMNQAKNIYHEYDEF